MPQDLTSQMFLSAQNYRKEVITLSIQPSFSCSPLFSPIPKLWRHDACAVISHKHEQSKEEPEVSHLTSGLTKQSSDLHRAICKMLSRCRMRLCICGPLTREAEPYSYASQGGDIFVIREGHGDILTPMLTKGT